MDPAHILRRLAAEVRSKGLIGAIRSVMEYVRWRRGGSPLVSEAPTLSDWQAAYSGTEPRRVGQSTFSIVCPVFNTPPDLLRECVSSIVDQTYDKWELILVDDASTNQDTVAAIGILAQLDHRITSLRLDQNEGIVGATNTGVDGAQGDYLVFIDHDDLMAPTALTWLSSVAGEADLIYTDEDKVYDDGTFGEVFFKPAWSPRLLLSVNYASHLTCIRTDLFKRVGRLRPGFDGVQDHDLLLRASEEDITVAHIPNVLYHWRAWSESAAGRPASKAEVEARGITMIQEAIDRRGWAAQAGLGPGSPFNYRVHFESEDPLAPVKVVIPTRDRAKLLEVVLDGLIERTDGLRLHTVIVDNGSRETDALDLLEKMSERADCTVVRVDDAFNFSRLCNIGVDSGPDFEHVLLLNNDIEIVHRNWLLQLSGWLRDPEVVGVGPKLLFPDGSIQHAGVIVGFGGIAGHYAGYQPNQPRPGDLHDQAREVGCLTAACLLLRTEDYMKVGGMNDVLGIDFQDVDLCLRLRSELGGQLMYDPTYPLGHAQSASRGAEGAVSGYTVSRMDFLWHPTLTAGDPYYSPHLSLQAHDLSLRSIPEGSAEKWSRLNPRFTPGL